MSRRHIAVFAAKLPTGDGGVLQKSDSRWTEWQPPRGQGNVVGGDERAWPRTSDRRYAVSRDRFMIMP